ncbi:hypothetical protein D4764_12G0002570 [Takifugu flavidus]|uniref:Uncharacterized protein n=1 Tax=Takifugu flavidus TaxID=433684 RepID=A0A5C6PEZ6_9TELE|nr:hypothetical protein D4764_12G0002570 [Takifugu flavidus]
MLQTLSDTLKPGVPILLLSLAAFALLSGRSAGFERQGWGLPRFPGHTQVADVHVCAEKHEPFIDEGVAIMLHVEKQVAG